MLFVVIWGSVMDVLVVYLPLKLGYWQAESVSFNQAVQTKCQGFICRLTVESNQLTYLPF